MTVAHTLLGQTYVELPSGRFEKATPALVIDPNYVSPIIFPLVSQDIVIQARYENMRLAGESHSMAEMLACRAFPGVKTDSVFNEGKFSGESGRIDPQELWRRKVAEEAGVSTTGKWYCSGLADYPGDPTAWVDGRGDVERIAREKNMTLHGYVEHRGHEVEPMGDTRIADDIINDEVSDILESNPFLNVEDVRERVTEVRTGRADPNPLLVKDYDSVEIP